MTASKQQPHTKKHIRDELVAYFKRLYKVGAIERSMLDDIVGTIDEYLPMAYTCGRNGNITAHELIKSEIINHLKDWRDRDIIGNGTYRDSCAIVELLFDRIYKLGQQSKRKRRG